MDDLSDNNENLNKGKKEKRPRCKNCGEELTFIARYCPKCGEELS